MSSCDHPTSALHFDKQHGTTVCTLCGDVVIDPQLELESIFSRANQINNNSSTIGGNNSLRHGSSSHLHHRATLINPNDSTTVDNNNTFYDPHGLEYSTTTTSHGNENHHDGINAIALHDDEENSESGNAQRHSIVHHSAALRHVSSLVKERQGSGNALRYLGGNRNGITNIRPMRAVIQTPMPHARPSIEVARRGMLAIARLLEISDDMVEMALAIYKLALNVNAIAGARHVVLCACLYAICRREKTSHVVYDFAAINNESPQVIISQMKHICEATHTSVPVIDISCLLLRFAQQMNLGTLLNEVMVCALKVLRAMEDDWIACGRRPMGVCAASLLVACYVFNIPRTPEQVCGMVRLTSETIAKRLNEFAATPAAGLTNIDEYQPSELTLPPAFNESSRRSTEEDVNAGLREMSAVYYELVAEAKVSSLPTPERCSKWRRFIEKHCELEGIAPSAESLDLSRLSAEAQLRILGLPHTKPISAEAVMESVKREESKLLLKREPHSTPLSDQEGNNNLNSENSGIPFPNFPFEPTQNSFNGGGGGRSNTQVAMNSNVSSLQQPIANNTMTSVNFDDPQQFRQLTDKYRELLNNAEVRGLSEDFNLDEANSNIIQHYHHHHHQQYDNEHDVYGNNTSRLRSPQPNEPSLQNQTIQNEKNNATSNNPIYGHDENSIKAAIAELLEDGERRHALPWQFIVLQSAEYEDTTDIIPYIVLDNEERIRRHKIGEALYKELWARGKPRTKTIFDELFKSKPAGNSTVRRVKRHVITGPVPVQDALERALRGRGAASVHTSQINQLIPGLLHVEEEEEEYNVADVNDRVDGGGEGGEEEANAHDQERGRESIQFDNRDAMSEENVEWE